MSTSRKSMLWSVLTIGLVFALVASIVAWHSAPIWALIMLACIAGLSYWRAIVWNREYERELQHALADKPHRGYDSVHDARVEANMTTERKQRFFTAY